MNWTLAGSLNVPASDADDHSELDPGPATFLTVSGLNIDATYVRVAALAEGPWTFASEVTFTEPAFPNQQCGR